MEDIGFLIKKINESIEKQANADLKGMKITLAQLRVLGCIRCQKDNGLETSQKDIERFLEVSHPTVVGILKTMEEKGLIETGFDSTDKRIKNVYEAKKAIEMKERFDRSREKMRLQLIKDLTEEEAEELYRLLWKVYQSVRPIEKKTEKERL